MLARLIFGVIRRLDKVSQIPGLIPTAMVALVLFFAWIAHLLGVPEILGGFAAGLALSRRFYFPLGVALPTDPQFADHIEKTMQPIIHLFTPLFFVAVGLSLDLQAVDWTSSFIWIFSLSLFIAAVIGKMAGAFLIPESWPARIAIGIAIISRGEVGLIFAKLGHESGIFNHQLYANLVIVIALTTLLGPFAMQNFYARLGGRLPLRGD